MNCRNHARQTESHEDTCANGSQLWSWELVPKRRYYREKPENGDDSQVYYFGLLVAVKAIVEPRNEWTHNQHRDPAIVKSKIKGFSKNRQSELLCVNSLAEQLPYDFRVTRNGVKCERKAQAKNRSDEESTENHFLLPIDLPCWANEEVNCSADEHYATKEMSPGRCASVEILLTQSTHSPNISCFRVQSENWFEASTERSEWRTVAFVKEVVVLQPVR